jgi:hypothetical protein
MTTYSYKGYDFDADHTPSPEEWKQIIAHFDYLEKEDQNTTNWIENIKIGAAYAEKSVLDWLQVVMPTIMGDPEKKVQHWNPETQRMEVITNQQLFESMKKAYEKITTEREKWANPEKKKQSFGGKIVSVIPQIPTFPFSAGTTGKESIDAGETLNQAIENVLVDTTGNLVGVAVPGAWGTGPIAKAGTGALAGAAQDTIVRSIISKSSDTEEIQNMFAPTWETVGLSAATGGMLGPLVPSGSPKKPTPSSEEKKSTVPITSDKQILDESFAKQSESALRKLDEDIQTLATKIETERNTLSPTELAAALNSYDLLHIKRDAISSARQDMETPNVFRSGRAQELETSTPIVPRDLSKPVEDSMAIPEALKVADESIPITKEQQGVQQELSAEPTISEKIDPVKQQEQIETLEALNKDKEITESGINIPKETEGIPTGLSLARDSVAGKGLAFNPGRWEKASIKTITDEIDYKQGVLAKLTEAYNREAKVKDNGYKDIKLNIAKQKIDILKQELADLNQILQEKQKAGQVSEDMDIPTVDASGRPVPKEEIQKAKENNDIVDKVNWYYEQGALTNLQRNDGKPSQIYIQSVLINSNKRVEFIIDSFVNKLGLIGERIDIVVDNNLSTQARTIYSGNRMIVVLNLKKINGEDLFNVFNDTYKDYGYLGFSNTKDVADFRIALALGHEFGHILLSKLIHSYWTNPHQLQSAIRWFESWKKKHPVEAAKQAITLPETMAKYLVDGKQSDYLLQFKEFFAQQVAKELIYKHHYKTNKIVSDKFDEAGNKIGSLKNINKEREYANKATEKSTTFWLDNPIKGFVETLRNAFKHLFESVFHLEPKNFFSPMTWKAKAGYWNPFNEFITKVIEENEASIKQFGETIFERYWKIKQDDLLSKGKGTGSIADTYQFYSKIISNFGDKSKTIKGSIYEDMPYSTNSYTGSLLPKEVLMAERKAHETWGDIPHISVQGIGAYFFAGIKNIGRQQFALTFENHPLIQATNKIISKAHNLSISYSEKWLHGDVTLDQYTNNKKYLITLDRIKTNDAISTVLTRLASEEAFQIHEVFRKGYENDVPYDVALKQYGQGLSPQSKKDFNTLANLFEQIWNDVVAEQVKMGKKKLMPFHNSWYPALRPDKFYVTISKLGVPVYVQHFPTEMAAKRFLSYAKGDHALQKYELSNISKVLDNSKEFDIFEQILDDLQADSLKKMDTDLALSIDKLRDRIQMRGGSFTSGGAKHHQYRSNMPGYMGSELYFSSKERGDSFKQAIHDYINQAATYLKKENIKVHTQKIIGTHSYNVNENRANVVKHQGIGENTVEAAFLLREHALNETTNYLSSIEEPFVAAIDDAFANGINRARKILGNKTPSWFPRIPITKRVGGVATTGFYFWNLVSRPTFALNQAITPLFAGRELLRENNFSDSMISMGLGLYNAHTQWEPAFTKYMYWATQNTHTIHPQFTMDLNKIPLSQALEESMAGKSLEWLSGYKPSSMADAYSRYVTSAIMFKHYQKAGYTGRELHERVAEAVDRTMVAYGRGEKAPQYQNFGFLGDMFSPLTSFPKAQMGNFYADIANLVRTKEGRAILPILWTPMVTALLTGASGTLFLAEYELLRHIFISTYNMFNDDDENDMQILDYSILKYLNKGDDFIHRAVDKGVIAAALDMDLLSSSRQQPLIQNNFITEDSSVGDMFLPYVFGKQMGEAIWALRINPNSTEGDKRKALMTLFPGGYKVIPDIVKFNALDREFVPMNKNMSALFPQTDKQVLAMALGTSTVTDKRTRERMYLANQEKEFRKNKIKNLKKQFEDAMFVKQDKERVKEIQNKLGKYGIMVTKKDVLNMSVKHSIPAYDRMKYGNMLKGGKPSASQIATFQTLEEFEASDN